MIKILVVDDNATNRKLLVTLLSSEGYQTVEAADGSDGLATARRENPKLVISDILMPTMDGYEFIRRLRTEPGFAGTGVIFYTAHYHEHEARALAQQCGVQRVLVKPCPQVELLAAVEQALAPAAAPAQPAQVEQQFDVEHLRLLTDKLSQKANELRAAIARLSALTNLNVQLASERDPRQLLQQVCVGARNLLGARYAVLAVQERGSGTSPIHCHSGLDFGSAGAPEISPTRGLLGKVFNDRRVHRLRSYDGTPLETGLPAAYPAAHAVLAVPIASLSRTYGCLYLADKVGAKTFSRHDEHLLAILGALVGRVYENGALYSDLQQHSAKLLREMEERERATTRLRSSEERFRQLAENIQDVFFVQTADRTQTLYVSPAYERIWGHAGEELRRDPLAWAAAVHADDRERTLYADRAITAALPQPGGLQFRIVRPDGRLRWIMTRIYPILDRRGGVSGVVGVATDITNRKVAEDGVLKLNRVYAMLSSINSLIVRVTDRAQLLREACRIAVEQGRFKAAWCGLVEPAARITQTAAAGELPGGGDFAHGADSDMGEQPFVVAAMQTRQPAVCNDLEAADLNDPLSCAMVAGGCRALAALPLLVGEAAVGCLVLISAEAGVFDDAEMRLLSELGGDISFALDHIDKADRLNYLAYYDALTGLANRTFLHERLAQHVRNRAQQQLFALIIIAIEGVDSLTDTLGRPGGDELLRGFAARLVRCAGDAGFVARCGSEEFAAVIPRPQDVMEVTRTVERWLSQELCAPFDIAGQSLTVAIRSGIALFPGDGTDAASLVHSAETALKTAKLTAATYAFYTPELGKSLQERRALESSLRRALDKEELVLYYQPKVDLETRRLLGAEALMRWRHPERGIVLPGTFIPVMEETGLIVEAGVWALRQAAADRARWLGQSLPAPRLAVNVSSAQLRREDFVRTVAAALRPTGPDAGIDIEVTESLLMQDVAENIEKLSGLRGLGVGIALDDFGTGYSSLAYLAKLPVETIKIDRSFVVAMLDDPSAMTLVSTVISLAHTLNLKTVAEGVESEEQAKMLRLLRCDQMQGYLISKPLPFDDMTTYLSGIRT
jgi:diguanylate cyclase